MNLELRKTAFHAWHKSHGALMVEFGGLDAKAKDNPKAFYTNDYLPK